MVKTRIICLKPENMALVLSSDLFTRQYCVNAINEVKHVYKCSNIFISTINVHKMGATQTQSSSVCLAIVWQFQSTQKLLHGL